MSHMPPDEDRADAEGTPWSADPGPEPEWADAIRKGRKERGDRLRAIFDAFADGEGPAEATPAGADEDAP